MLMQLGGGITEKKQAGLFSEAKSMPQIIEAITKAAHDPRVSGIYLKLSRLDIGWAKAQELARHIRFFKQSGVLCWPACHLPYAHVWHPACVSWVAQPHLLEQASCTSLCTALYCIPSSTLSLIQQ